MVTTIALRLKDKLIMNMKTKNQKRVVQKKVNNAITYVGIKVIIIQMFNTTIVAE